MPHFIARLLINAVALAVAANIVPGIHIAGNDTASIVNILIVALIFGIVNAVIKPLLALVTCPFYVFTLGLFTFVVNALMLMLTSWFAGGIFKVYGFGAAFWGSIVISIISTVLSVFLIDDKKKK
jgi:putative membrane protein